MSKVISVFEFISYLSNRFVIPYHDKPLEPLHVQKTHIILSYWYQLMIVKLKATFFFMVL